MHSQDASFSRRSMKCYTFALDILERVTTISCAARSPTCSSLPVVRMYIPAYSSHVPLLLATRLKEFADSPNSETWQHTQHSSVT